MGKLSGKTVVVTGSSSGIGQGIARRLAEDGANLVVNYRHEEAGAKDTLHMVEAAGAKGVIVQADVAEPESARKLIDVAEERFGAADVLVNNSGIEKKADFWDVTPEDYDRVMNVNLRGVFFLTQYFVQKLKQRGARGAVINISSVHEDMAFPGFSSYCISKGGMRMLTRSLAVELGPLGITVNNVAPGAIATPINQSLLKDKPKLDALLGNIPLGRLGEPKDVAGVVAFLASEDGSYFTGSTLIVDGGLIRNYREQ